MRILRVEEAIGFELGHDITKIIPGEFKGVAFKKGHIIRLEDIEELLAIGKENIYVVSDDDELLHENEAAEILRDLVAGEGITFNEVREGKSGLIADRDGLLKIDVEALFSLNYLGDIILSTLHNNTIVKRGCNVAATKIIPLEIKKEKIEEAKDLIKSKLGTEKIVKVIPINKKKTAIITTGSEVYSGRIKDSFGPLLKEKLDKYGCEILGQSIIPDEAEKVKEAISMWLGKGAEMILCTGGMSVDADDITAKAIKASGAEIIVYGTPVLPGAMLLLAYNGNIPIVGIPGGALFSKNTIFDIILPRILAGERIERKDIAAYGYGGLCMNCNICTFPKCTFGKGI